LTGIALLNVNVLLSLAIEKVAARHVVPELVVRVLSFLNLASVLGVPCIVIYSPLASTPPAASCYVFIATVLWMKLVSYTHVNQDLRKYTRANDEDAMELRRSLAAKVKHAETTTEYPANLSVADLYYFWAAPTLSYQLDYPRTEKIRGGYVASLVSQIVVFSGLIIFISAQYILPHIKAAMPDFESGSIPVIVERVLRLSLSTTYVWLLGFYLVFHLFLNLLAELLRFGDRVFYKDWWNATTVGEYWRLWNLPVHHWMVRHCFFPCLRLGMSKSLAIFCVFFVSAVFHEFLVSVPFKRIRAWAFLAMMSQIPLVALSKRMDKIFSQGNEYIGNMLFWGSFCILGKLGLKGSTARTGCALIPLALRRATPRRSAVLLRLHEAVRRWIGRLWAGLFARSAACWQCDASWGGRILDFDARW